MEWTDRQKEAITARGGTLLLSAAAGSGKTAVLVERIIQRLTDENDPIKPSELLVVTFTNAAAAEMRTRINAAVEALMEKDPENSFYRNIRMQLPEAQISTIDSFCIKLVRENFYAADILPDFDLLDNTDLRIFSAEAITRTLDELCREKPDVYDLLNSVFVFNRDDSDLAGKIKQLYNYSLAHPFPEQWLDNIKDMYNSTDDIKATVWGRVIINNMMLALDNCSALLHSALPDLENCPEVMDKYAGTIAIAIDDINILTEFAENASWDELTERFAGFALPKLPAAPRGFGDDPVKICVKNKYDRVKDIIKEVSGCFCADTAENAEDSAFLLPVIDGLVCCVRSYGKNFMDIKEAHGGYDFTDIMHKALKLLTVDENGTKVKSPLAYSLSEQYREILIDEYQDINEAQDMLFKLVSRNGENLFMVGDVKQSIYGFRLAMPEIFVKKSREYNDYVSGKYPAKIILGTNFRSRKGVLDSINYLFYNIMTEQAGEMDYTKDDALYYGNGYDEDTEPSTELHFVESGDETAAAEHIADVIENMIRSGVTVAGKNGKRPASYKDFCILLRSTKSKSELYENVLIKKGVPVYGEKKGGLFDATEINIFMSLLRAIDNPADDIAMLALMFSPMYGFTPDETAELKLPDKRRNLYSCLLASDTDKAKKLVNDLDDYRRMSAVMPFDIFIRSLLDITGYAEAVSALKRGEVRRTNLIILTEIAAEYAGNGGSGLGGFIRYVNRAVENGAEIPSASDISADVDVVRIYSIHKSKGLEFPFVILADCDKSFNMSDVRNDMIVNEAAGVGIMIQNDEKLQKYDTIGHVAAKISVKRSLISEELRILYVAMTRAREKLICVTCASNLSSYFSKVATDITGTDKVHPYAVLNANSYAQWLLMGYLRHPDTAGLTDFDSLISHDYKNYESRLKVVVAKQVGSETADCPEEQLTDIDEELVDDLKARVAYRYPYIIPESARPKRIASEFENSAFSEEYFASSKPSFAYGGKLSPAQIGTANHLFLQCMDINTENVEFEVDKMKRSGVLSSEQAAAIRTDKVKKFLASDLCGRIRNADVVYREKDFTVEVPLGVIDESVQDNVKNEKIIILGKADLVFVENGQAVVVDYKTDRSKDEKMFIEAYGGQLKMYRIAMEQLLEIPVKETIIYSLHLEKEIRI